MIRKRKPTKKAAPRKRNRNKNDRMTSTAVQRSGFWHVKSIEELAAEQGVEPIRDMAQLRGDFWPEDESLDDFLAWLRRLRRDNG